MPSPHSGALDTSSVGDGVHASILAYLNKVTRGQVPYNAVAGFSVGPGGSGKTQTHRSVMGEPFDKDAERVSTVGTDTIRLEVCQTQTKMLDLKRAEATSLLERTIWAAASNLQVEHNQSIDVLVNTEAGRGEVRKLITEYTGMVSHLICSCKN